MPAKKVALEIVKRLQKAGYTAYFAGGCVRDMLMEHPYDDIDIATSAPVAMVQQLFPKTIPVGVAFGIVIVVEEGHHFEVATFRSESDYLDGRRPSKVSLASDAEDALRRDFTINGMFYDPVKEEVIDYVGGKKDLSHRLIRAIGNPHHRFLEDRLRMIRAVRYSARFDFPIEQATYEAILAHAPDLFPAVALERIWQEFTKISKFAHVDTAFIALHELTLLGQIFPELQDIPSSEIARRVCHFGHFPQNTPPLAYLLALFPRHSLTEKERLGARLKLSRQEQNFIAEHHHIFTQHTLSPSCQDKLTPWEWTQLYSLEHAPLCLALFAATLEPLEQENFWKTTKARLKNFAPYIKRLQEKDPLVKAHDLLNLGIEKGPELGRLLKRAEEVAANCALHSKAAVLEHLLRARS